MSSDVYAVSEIVGSSTDSIEEAIENALARARKTLRNLDWFEVTEVRGAPWRRRAASRHYQVTLKLGFKDGLTEPIFACRGTGAPAARRCARESSSARPLAAVLRRRRWLLSRSKSPAGGPCTLTSPAAFSPVTGEAERLRR